MSEQIKTNIILSYPRSGNHLVRFFVEMLSETPTLGCLNNELTDREMFRIQYSEELPFNIKKRKEWNDVYRKVHFIDELTQLDQVNKLIFIIRNPREVMLSHSQMDLDIILKDKYEGQQKDHSDRSFTNYFRIIDYYNKCKGKKLLLFYEDNMIDTRGFIEKLYDFLEIDSPEKKKYVLDNIDYLFKASASYSSQGGGNKSKGNIKFYYERLSEQDRTRFDNWLNPLLEKYPFIKEKYDI
jgi:hypothetical protein